MSRQMTIRSKREGERSIRETKKQGKGKRRKK